MDYTEKDKQAMIERFECNRRAAKYDDIECAFCAEPMVKTTHSRQFCKRTGSRNCKESYHRFVRLGMTPDASRAGQEPKLDAIKHKRAILNDLNRMTRKEVADKYNVSKTTLYKTLIRWGCRSYLFDSNTDTMSNLTDADRVKIFELCKTEAVSVVANKFNVSVTTIRNVLSGDSPRDEFIAQLGMETITAAELKNRKFEINEKHIVYKNNVPIMVAIPINEWLMDY